MSEPELPGEDPLEAGGPDQPAGGDTSEAPVTRPRRRGLRSNKIKVLVVVAIIGIALVIVLWGASPPDYITLEELMEDSGSYEGKDVTVRGKVGNWTGGQNFTMIDHKNASIEIQVIHENPIPEGFAEEKDIVLDGRLENRDSGLIIISTEIQVGCPSKY